ncbi:MAG: hypothetical protein GC183_14800 [Thiobacillus sp.]|nr:hypothetical protein [Thiobacillus sp.]
MNVSSASLNAASLFAKAAAAPNADSAAAGPATPKSPLVSLLEEKSPSISSASRSDNKKTPQQDVAEKLKALGEQFLAIMLITDPVDRARAAKDMYEKYAQTGEEYAGAVEGQRAVAEAAGQPYDRNPNPGAGDGMSPVDSAAAGAAIPALTMSAAPSAASLTYRDLSMEQIKSFANVARQVYETAVDEARRKEDDDKKLNGFDAEMKDAREVLDKAAKSVEGPGATAEGFDAVVMATSKSAAPLIVDVRA